MKLGVYVGSFNPPHMGHLNVINYLINNKIVDKVIVLPTPNYWDKNNMASIKDREEMLKFFQTNKIIIDTINNKHKYTYQVLESLKNYYNTNNLYLIIGSDNLEKFHLWKNIDDILNYQIIVLRRGNTNIEKYLSKFNKNNFVVIDNFPFIDISSTEIRNGSDDYLDENIKQYIKKNNLYQED